MTFHLIETIRESLVTAEQILTHHIALTLLDSLQHLLQHLRGSLLRSYCLTRPNASVLYGRVVKGFVLFSALQWFLTLMFPIGMALPV